MTSPACSYCCGGLSAFAVVFLLGASCSRGCQSVVAFVSPCGQLGVHGALRSRDGVQSSLYVTCRPRGRYEAACRPTLRDLAMASKKSKKKSAGASRSGLASATSVDSTPLRSEASIVSEVRRAVQTIGNGVDASPQDLERVAALLGDLEDHNGTSVRQQCTCPVGCNHTPLVRFRVVTQFFCAS